jgi:hypothetical protein
VTPDVWETHYRGVDYVARPGAPSRNRATWVVEDGQRALRRA